MNKIRFLGGCTGLGTLIALGGCVAVPSGPYSDGYYGGQYNVSFIAGGPFEDPRIVVLVVVDDPGPQLVREKRYFGAIVAGPANRRIMERTLNYLGVQPSVPFGETSQAAAAE